MRTSPSPSPGRASWWRWPLLAAVVLVVYVPVVRFDFVNWDDDLHVYQQPCVTDPDGLARCWGESSKAGYYPLTSSTFHLEWQLTGGAPWLFHLDNVLLHAANVVLVGLLAGVLGLSPVASLSVAALWGLHPIQVATVAWVTERKNVLYVCFWLAALLVHLHAVTPGRSIASRVVAILLFLCAVASKSAAAATLPAAILVIELARGRSLDRRLIADVAPYVIFALVGGFVYLAWLRTGVVAPSLGVRLGLAARALWFYIAKFFWPVDLLPVYPRWPAEAIGAAGYLSLAGIVGVAAAIVVLHRRIPPTALIGLGLFVVNAIPVVGIAWFIILAHSHVYDHLAYLPSFGLALFSAVVVREVTRAARRGQRAATAALAVWCVVLATLTWRQIPVWRDSATLWTYNLERNPGCFVCALNFGNARLAEERLDDAAELYRRAARLDPADERPAYNLADVLGRQGRIPEAIAQYREALRLAPDSIEVHNNLGVALARAGRTAEAEAEFRETLRFAPRDPEAHLNLAELAAERGDWATAVSHYETVVHDQPGRMDAVESLATALTAAGRVGEAVRVLRGGIAAAPNASRLAGLLAWILATNPDASQRDGAEAIRIAERACALTGYRDPDLLDTLAAAYAESGRFEDALRTARRALTATESGSELAGNIARRIALYEAGRPYRDE